MPRDAPVTSAVLSVRLAIIISWFLLVAYNMYDRSKDEDTIMKDSDTAFFIQLSRAPFTLRN
jgi:hypothetical protein